MIAANSLVPSPVVFSLNRDPLDALCRNRTLLNQRSAIGSSEEHWFAYSLQHGEYANAIVFGWESNPTLDGRGSGELWLQIRAFLQRFGGHWVALKSQRLFDEMRTMRTVFLSLNQFVDSLVQCHRIPPRPPL